MNKTLYFNSWDFNAARVLDEVKNLILEAGGHIVSNYFEELDNYKLIHRETGEQINVHFTKQINFILDEKYISFWLDSNPFFEFYFQKYNFSQNKYRHYCEELKKEGWCFDYLLTKDCTSEQIKESAQLLFKILLGLPDSDVVTQKKLNRYTRHYEYIPEKNNNPFKEYHVLL